MSAIESLGYVGLGVKDPTEWEKRHRRHSVRARRWTDLLPRQRNAVGPPRHEGQRERLERFFLGHPASTLAKFKVPESEQRDVVTFVQSLKKDIVE
jgi:hypothetical protein